VGNGDAPSERISLLIVEDETSIREMLVHVFEIEGLEVRTASDGEAALRAVAERLPDVVVLDLGIPRLSGADFLRRLRADGLEVAVIVVSASLDGARIASEAGADAYLAKPFDLDELIRRVTGLAARAGPRPARHDCDDGRPRDDRGEPPAEGDGLADPPA
jgi:two-component system OmpR family response regulator